MTRQQERRECAKKLCALSPECLFWDYGITRVGELTGLDSINVPVWTAIRPMSHSVSANAGKSRDPFLAKAGAIAEAIEVALFESPSSPHSKRPLALRKLKEYGLPVAASAKKEWYELEEEPVLHYKSGNELLFPSDLVWLDQRENSPFLRSSNGQALGATPEDAVLQGLYECIERDAMTIQARIEAEKGLLPPFVDLSDAPEPVKILVQRIEKASLRVFVARATYDIPLPIYCAFLLDPSESHASFYGYGTSIFDAIAVEKAILEAIQSRAVYIAGARDDIPMSRFSAAKRARQKFLVNQIELIQPKLPVDWSSYEITTEEELEWAFQDIGPWAANMFIKVLEADFCAAKVFVTGLEPPPMPDWAPVRWHKIRENKDALFYGTNSIRV